MLYCCTAVLLYCCTAVLLYTLLFRYSAASTVRTDTQHSTYWHPVHVTQYSNRTFQTATYAVRALLPLQVPSTQSTSDCPCCILLCYNTRTTSQYCLWTLFNKPKHHISFCCNRDISWRNFAAALSHYTPVRIKSAHKMCTFWHSIGSDIWPPLVCQCWGGSGTKRTDSLPCCIDAKIISIWTYRPLPCNTSRRGVQ